MKFNQGLTTAIISTFCIAFAAVAEPVYTADDVIKYFSQNANLGANRTICVGTEQECDQKADAARKPAKGFNLTVTFDFGSAALTAAARENLIEFATALQDDRLARARFRLEGHTDAIGDSRKNLELSEARARAVAKYLVTLGVSVVKLTPVGFGETRPVMVEDPNHPSNRRVEAQIVFQ